MKAIIKGIIMKKIFRIMVAFGLILAGQAIAETRVIACDSCTTAQNAESYAVQHAYVPPPPNNSFEPPSNNIPI
jgi:hypothetical protein